MEAEKLDDLTELRFRQLERLTSSLLEGQQDTIQILAEHSRRFERIENRLESMENRQDRVEELLTLALDDLAFIKEVLTPKQ